MIKVYPVKIEAVDESNNLAFTIETFDQHCASVEFKALIGPSNIDELVAAMRTAVQMLELE